MHWRIEHHRDVPSTSDLVLERARGGEAEGLVVVAERQTRGRGRHGRSWSSPPGNLYMSVLLRPTRPAAELASLSLVTGLAVRQAIAAATSGSVVPELKWPNDLIVSGAKLGGILLESEAAGGATAVAAGIGVNIRSAPDLPDRPTVALANLLDRPPGPGAVARAILEAFAPLLTEWNAGGFAPLRDRWLAAAHGLGEAVQLRLSDRVVRGRFLGVDARGRLELGEEPGGRRVHDAGELFFGTGAARPLAGRVGAG